MKIIVIEALGLHVGYLGCYGNDWVATPNFDRLAAEGIVFDRHIADQPELQPTTPWHQRSVGTGCYALPGHAALAADAAKMPRLVRCEALPQFAMQVLRAIKGDADWIWIEGPNLLPPWHLDAELLAAYFDEDDVEEGLEPWIDPPLAVVNMDEAEVLELQNTYAAVMSIFDAQLGVLLDRLPLQDTLLCVTARSGLPLGEHGMIGTPRPLLHAELVHVPLLMRLPNAESGGLRIPALTQPVDLLPTILEALSRPIPPLHGCSLLPLIREEMEQVRPYAVSGLRIGAEENWLLRSPEWALHLPIAGLARMPRLFVKPEDRWEVNDLYQHQIETADRMEKALRAFGEAIRQPGPLAYPPI